MRECRDCEFFNGWDYSDGTPRCDCDGGYESCPYCNYANAKNNGMKIEIDAGFMHDYILHTMKNTIENEACRIATAEIKNLVTNDIKQCVLAEMNKQIQGVIENEIAVFMNNEITVGGGWREPERKLTRTQYLAETIEKALEDKFKSDAIKSYAEREAKTAIDGFERKLRDQINAGIKTYFNEATRQVLTENVVSMLMCNDTYKKLSDSMQTFLPSGK